MEMGRRAEKGKKLRKKDEKEGRWDRRVGKGGENKWRERWGENKGTAAKKLRP